jgi:hypothetical protein
MSKLLRLGAMATALLVVTACGASPALDDSGWVGMQPFVSTESGVRGLMPMEGWSDAAQVVQGSAPLAMDEVTAELLKQTSLQQLPQVVGTYQSVAITWDLFDLEGHLPDVEPLLRLKVALGESESASYWVLLVVLPEAYEANPRLYDTVFRHALYALRPLA